MEKISDQLAKLKQFLFNQFQTGFFFTKILNPTDISTPIVNAINNKKQEVLDPDEISTPIIDKLDELLRSNEGKEFPTTLTISNLKEITTVFKEELSKIETNVTVDQKAPNITIENKELVKSFEKLILKLTHEQIDYTPIMSEMCDLIEQSKTVIDINKIEILLAEIFAKDTYIPIEDDRVKVTLSDEQLKKIGKGFGTYYPTDHHLRNVNGVNINPATEETLQDSLDNYHASDEDNTTTHDYYGYITKDGAWAIEQIDNTTMAHRYIKGASDYATNWTNRLSLTYDYFNTIF